MKTTANTRALVELAKAGELIPVEMAEQVQSFTAKLLEDNIRLEKLVEQRWQEVVNLSKANGELGMKVVDIVLEIKPDMEKLKKVVRLLADQATKELQKKLGPKVIDMMMEAPEQFNAKEREAADLHVEPAEVEPTEIPPQG